MDVAVIVAEADPLGVVDGEEVPVLLDDGDADLVGVNVGAAVTDGVSPGVCEGVAERVALLVAEGVGDTFTNISVLTRLFDTSAT